MGIFTPWRIIAWTYAAVVNDMIFAYNIIMFIAWLIFNILNVLSFICIYSLYLELNDLTKIQDLARLKVIFLKSLSFITYWIIRRMVILLLCETWMGHCSNYCNSKGFFFNLGIVKTIIEIISQEKFYNCYINIGIKCACQQYYNTNTVVLESTDAKMLILLIYLPFSPQFSLFHTIRYNHVYFHNWT